MPDLRALADDMAGSRLPAQFRPWRIIGAVAPDNLSRDAIETAVEENGFQLWRVTEKGLRARSPRSGRIGETHSG